MRRGATPLVHTYPEGFIPVRDAFAQALELIEDYTALRRGIDEATTNEERHKAINKHDASARRVEKLMRDAIADGRLKVFTRGQNGQIEQIVEREEFGRGESFGVPGFENVPHHLTSPGPDTHGQPVFLSISNFQEWLTTHRHAIDPFRTGGPGKPSAIMVVAREHQRRLRCGEAFLKVSEEAVYLKEWLDRTYPEAPNLTAKTIENRIRGAHRKRPRK